MTPFYFHSILQQTLQFHSAEHFLFNSVPYYMYVIQRFFSPVIIHSSCINRLERAFKYSLCCEMVKLLKVTERFSLHSCGINAFTRLLFICKPNFFFGKNKCNSFVSVEPTLHQHSSLIIYVLQSLSFSGLFSSLFFLFRPTQIKFSLISISVQSSLFMVFITITNNNDLIQSVSIKYIYMDPFSYLQITYSVSVFVSLTLFFLLAWIIHRLVNFNFVLPCIIV